MDRVTIIDFERGEAVGVLHDDGTLETDDQYLEDFHADLMDQGGAPVMTGGYDEETDTLWDGVEYLEPGETAQLSDERQEEDRLGRGRILGAW